ncbi:unnamed protein product [Ectocarpus sp. 6 AP-2014]
MRMGRGRGGDSNDGQYTAVPARFLAVRARGLGGHT